MFVCVSVCMHDCKVYKRDVGVVEKEKEKRAISMKMKMMKRCDDAAWVKKKETKHYCCYCCSWEHT